MKKQLVKTTGLLSIVALITACAQEANVAMNTSEGSSDQKTISMAHIHGEADTVYGSIELLNEGIEEKTDGQIKVENYGESVLGDERELLELMQNGVVDMVKVSGAVMENFSHEFSAFSLPYVFEDEDHFFEVMDSDYVDELYAGLEDVGMRGITYYDAGARSFYTVDTPIKHPDDINGLKIRSMNSATQIGTMEALGASPTPLPAPEVYTGMQQGMIDGAESNPAPMTEANHGEVAKHYSFNEHTRVPDFVVMSADTWDNLSAEEQDIVMEAAQESTEAHNEAWSEEMEANVEQAKEELNVEFHYPELEPFREEVEPLIEEYREDPEVAEILDEFERMAP
ncbi:TRAP transporter substrate-binding protein [Salsuginibacillus kocurii]|uniref:TRAP transporter substrate-binding protein n=1 Tax=Salsuginibacillus kocurii TaxID=427078 RepID=UPI0003809EF4|nr:TRAP transporter substrate-binding protein [Salsuginibacillus kocurii]